MGKMKDLVCFDTPHALEWEDDITFSREFDEDMARDFWAESQEDAMMEAHLFGDC